MIKILHVITNLNTGGAEKLMVDLLPRLINKNVEIELCLFNGSETPFLLKLKERGIKIHSFGFKESYYNPSHIRKLINLAKNFDIIHTHNTAPQLFGAIASIFCKQKWVSTEHTTTSNRRVWWYKPIERWMYHQYDKMLCISQAAKDSVQMIAGTKKPETCIIPNGIDLDLYKNAFALERNSIGADSSDKKILLMVGRYSYQKDQATIIKALSLLPNNIELWLAGYGETESELKQLAKNCNVDKRVFLLGMRNDIPALLKTCDIVVQSSHIEGFGLAAVEAMGAGKPVIATDIPGLRNVVEGAGLLFEHENHKMLAETISLLINDEKLTEELISKGHDRALKYSIDRMTDNYYKSYLEILN